jgi:hypothetical protein
MKHHTAITHRLTAIPAALPEIAIDSQLARRKLTIIEESIGAYSDPRSQAKNDATTIVPRVKAAQHVEADCHVKKAKGTLKIKAVGG